MLTSARIATLSALLLLPAAGAQAFCGFYVAQADSKLFNKTSKLVVAHQSKGAGDHEIAMTMASDYQGDPKEFAVVVPVPTFIERKQIGVVEIATIDHLDAYTAPRLVEYHDSDPCYVPPKYSDSGVKTMAVPAPRASAMAVPERYRGVTVEARYEVGEYDIIILAAKESDGLVNWLTDNQYRLPDGAQNVLGSYIKQEMRFFLAKVNLDRMQMKGQSFLRPLQVRYTSAKFMIPIRLGTLNANGPQDLIAFVLSPRGRVETTNYQTVALPTDNTVPLYVKQDFGNFYKAMFEHSVAKKDMKAVFLEYAWDMAWCDPCAADPLKNSELVELGARWIDSDEPKLYRGSRGDFPGVYVTRLHVRYDSERFPEDLMLQETANKENFQGRYALQHPWRGAADCKAGDSYFDGLPDRFSREADTLADLTGWDKTAIKTKMTENGQPFESQKASGLGAFWRRVVE
ncbi:conserved exported hypothetical protein [Candidatus Terasakiella magnetica]|nr:conserved exported hypothetical protein [Candidatus Terasakiella magnetica]